MSGSPVSEKTHCIHAFQCRKHLHPIHFGIHRTSRALESAHCRITVYPDEQSPSEISRVLEVGDMANMKDVKTTIGHHQLFAAFPNALSPVGQLPGLNDFMAEIHGASLPLRMPAANSKSNPTIFAF